MSGTVIITGASRGIGAATARLAAARGWTVAVNYNSAAEAAGGVVRDIVEGGGHAIAVQADMGREADIVAMFEKVDAVLGPLDALVCNAGSTGDRRCRIEEMTNERIARLLAVNVTGTILCMREAVRRMSTRHGGRGGSIVNVSSVSARLGAPNLWMDYAASKGAVDTLTIGAAKELAEDGIRVNGIRPGMIDTEIHAAAGMPDRVLRSAKHLPMKRPGTADEVSQAIVWLISREASYVSGSIVDVSGGV